MLPDDLLAISSLSGARLGIDGLVRIAVFAGGMAMTIGNVSRHEYSPSGYAVWGLIVISLISGGIGGVIGQGSSSVVWALLFCGAASFICAGPFLEFRPVHRAILGAVAPVLLVLSVLIGRFVEQAVIENALK